MNSYRELLSSPIWDRLASAEMKIQVEHIQNELQRVGLSHDQSNVLRGKLQGIALVFQVVELHAQREEQPPEDDTTPPPSLKEWVSRKPWLNPKQAVVGAIRSHGGKNG